MLNLVPSEFEDMLCKDFAGPGPCPLDHFGARFDVHRPVAPNYGTL